MEVSINGGAPKFGWFIMKNPVKMDDLRVPGYPHFGKPPFNDIELISATNLTHMLQNEPSKPLTATP
jgi:hypothetical protein